jgi:hypothetical protein
MLCAVLVLCPGGIPTLRAELPNPVLQSVFPAGAQAGTTVTVTVEGTALDGLRDLRSNAPGFVAEKREGNRFNVSIAAATPPGVYDLRAVTDHGMSAPRAFMVSCRAEKLEGDSNDTFESPTPVDLNTVIGGRIEKPGDVDCFRFAAQAGQRVVVECWAERIDSQLHGVIEVFNAQGQRLAVSRGHAGTDPLVDVIIPVDGAYDVRLFDLSYLGSSAHFYRLDLDTLARPEFTLPCVLPRGQTARVKLFGRNLLPGRSSAATHLDVVEVDVTPPNETTGLVPLPRRPSQIAAEAFAYHYAAGHLPVAIGVTDVPVVENTAGHDRADRALELQVPCEVSAQIAEGRAQHWYAISAKRGEVLWFEGLGDRIGSPVDLDLSVLDPTGNQELVRFSDQFDNLGGYHFSTTHTDPAGRWIAPADGRYLVLVRNLLGGMEHDPRRIYRLSVRREEPDYQLAVVSRRTDQPAAWNVPRGGRELVEVLALRRRGMAGPIRVTAEGLPAGIDCPEIWIGPGQDRAPLVATATSDGTAFAGALNIAGHAEQAGVTLDRRAHGGAMIWPGRPLPSGRVTQEVSLATGVDAPLLLRATPKVTSLDQQSVLDVEVTLESRSGNPMSPVRLSGVGLPRGVELGRVTLPPEASRGWMSFFWPAALPPGPYTFAIQAEFEAMVANNSNSKTKPAKTSLTVVSNPVTIEVKAARIVLDLDPASPTKIARGKIVQLRFTAERVNGFLGKVHTELVAPGGVVGLRARGVTLTGQADSGSLQVIATDNAPLGRHSLLRLEAVGTVEDQPIYRASRPVELEIIE